MMFVLEARMEIIREMLLEKHVFFFFAFPLTTECCHPYAIQVRVELGLV